MPVRRTSDCLEVATEVVSEPLAQRLAQEAHCPVRLRAVDVLAKAAGLRPIVVVDNIHTLTASASS